MLFMADNPLISGFGMCDSHIRIFEGKGSELMQLDWYALNQPDSVKVTESLNDF